MKYISLVLLIGTLLSSFAKSEGTQKYKVYILQPGDTLSELLARENYSPLYGPGNWVQRIVEANHLTKTNVSKIKKGLPIILPTDKDITKPFNTTVLTKMVKDEVSIKKSARIQTGLFANSISKHQNYSVNFGYFYRDINTKSFSVDSGENFLLSVDYKDKKNKSFMGLKANPTAQLGINTHGSNYTSEDSVLNFQPTLFLSSSLLFQRDNKIELGPKLRIESSSKAEIDQEDLTVRRDNLAWAGIAAHIAYDTRRTTYNFGAEFLSTIASQNTNGFDNLSGFQFGTKMDVNLLNNYFIGVFASREIYENTINQNITQTGITLRYILE